MLPFKNRLTKKKDIESVQKRGLFFSDGNIAIKYFENNQADTRVGFIAGLKFSKKAVARNQVKRQLREIFQNNLKNIKKGVDVVVMARKRDDERISFNKLEENANRLLKKSGLIEK